MTGKDKFVFLILALLTARAIFLKSLLKILPLLVFDISDSTFDL